MEKQRLIETFNNLDTISYYDGKKYDNFHFGQIISHCIENQLRYKGSYQELNSLLASTLTLTGSQNLLQIYEQGSFDNYKELIAISPEIKENFKEVLIIEDFKSILCLINLEFNSIINKKEKLVKTYIRNILTEIITRSQKINNLINFDDALDYINNRTLELS